jgi:hypothetical protein
MHRFRHTVSAPLALTIVAGLAFSVPAIADQVVYFVNGKAITVKKVERGDRLTILEIEGGGRIGVPTDQIDRVEDLQISAPSAAVATPPVVAPVAQAPQQVVPHPSAPVPPATQATGPVSTGPATQAPATQAQAAPAESAAVPPEPGSQRLREGASPSADGPAGAGQVLRPVPQSGRQMLRRDGMGQQGAGLRRPGPRAGGLRNRMAAYQPPLNVNDRPRQERPNGPEQPPANPATPPAEPQPPVEQSAPPEAVDDSQGAEAPSGEEANPPDQPQTDDDDAGEER